MGRGRSSGGGRGFSSSSGRGWSSSGRGRGSSHTTVIIGGTRYYGGSGSGSIVSGVIACFFLAVITIFAGFGLMINNSQYDSVYGTAVENRDSGLYYYTSYSYTIDGITYVEESEVGWELPEDIGKTVELFYEKDCPTSISEEDPTTSGGLIAFLFVLGGAFTVSGILLLKVALNKKKNQDESSNSQDNSGYTSGGSQQVKCPYCGAKHTGSTCPKCGASNL